MVISLVPTPSISTWPCTGSGIPMSSNGSKGARWRSPAGWQTARRSTCSPRLHYVPYPYSPLYFWVSGALARVTGVGFLPLRLVSLVSSLGLCAVLVRIVWRETGDVVAGVVASGLFTATFAVSGAWFDIGRVDSLAPVPPPAARSTWPAGPRRIGGGSGRRGARLRGLHGQAERLSSRPPRSWCCLSSPGAGSVWPRLPPRRARGRIDVRAQRDHPDWYGYYVFEELVHQVLHVGLEDVLHQEPLAHALGARIGLESGWPWPFAQAEGMDRPTGCTGQSPSVDFWLVPGVAVAFGRGT